MLLVLPAGAAVVARDRGLTPPQREGRERNGQVVVLDRSRDSVVVELPVREATVTEGTAEMGANNELAIAVRLAGTGGNVEQLVPVLMAQGVATLLGDGEGRARSRGSSGM